MAKRSSAKKATSKQSASRSASDKAQKTQSNPRLKTTKVTPKKRSAAEREDKVIAKSPAKKRPEPQEASAQTPVPPPLVDVRQEDESEDTGLPKTQLTDKQLREFKNLLLRKRTELVGDVKHLTDEALNRTGEGLGDNSTMPIHMADLGSDNWEQELTLGFIENDRVRLREIDEALQRIENRTYGICLATHNPISVARLRAKPWATFCIDYARLRDEGRAP